MSIEAMVAQGRIDRVLPSPNHAARLMRDAANHIESARMVATLDPNGGFQLAYDAGRKAASSILAAEGLRATSKGGHVATISAMSELGIHGFAPLDRMRRKRNRLEYPDEADAPATEADVVEAATSALDMLAAARQWLIDVR